MEYEILPSLTKTSDTITEVSISYRIEDWACEDDVTELFERVAMTLPDDYHLRTDGASTFLGLLLLTRDLRQPEITVRKCLRNMVILPNK
jgi:hypothetical protein